MLRVMKQCVSELNWWFVAGGLVVLVAIALCAKLSTVSIFTGAAPLFLLAVCLVPCLLPLVWMRNTGRGEAKKAPVPEGDRES